MRSRARGLEEVLESKKRTWFIMVVFEGENKCKLCGQRGTRQENVQGEYAGRRWRLAGKKSRREQMQAMWTERNETMYE